MCNAIGEEDLQKLSKNIDQIQNFYYEARRVLLRKCRRTTGGDELPNKLLKVYENLEICLGDHLPTTAEKIKELHDSSSSDEEFCTTKRIPVQDCFKDLHGIWKECSNDDEKFLPDFAFDIMKALLDYVCVDEKAFYEKWKNSADCMNSLDESFLGVCANESGTSSDDPLTKPGMKELICRGMEIAETCYGKYIAKECPGSDFNELFSGLLGAMRTACDEKHKRSVPSRFRLY